jgi:hypothetical protein
MTAAAATVTTAAAFTAWRPARKQRGTRWWVSSNRPGGYQPQISRAEAKRRAAQERN